MDSNQEGRSDVTSKDGQPEDSESNTVADTDTVSPVDTGEVDEKTEENSNEVSPNTKSEAESIIRRMMEADPSGWTMKEFILSPGDAEIKLAENYHSIGYPTPTLREDMMFRYSYHNIFGKERFGYWPFLAFGRANFMSYAAHFCKCERKDKAEIISIGSGNGSVDRGIISTYRKHFGEEIEITLVDPNPDYEVHFKTVDDLIEARPEAVGNCILLIIWPEPTDRNDGYDIDAVRKLQPRAALVLYEPTGISASEKFSTFLREKTKEPVHAFFKLDHDHRGLENYAVENVTALRVNFEAGPEIEMFGDVSSMPPSVGFYQLRLLKLRRA